MVARSLMRCHVGEGPEVSDGFSREGVGQCVLYILMGLSEDGSVVTWFDVRNFLMGCSGGGSVVLWRVVLKWLVVLARHVLTNSLLYIMAGLWRHDAEGSNELKGNVSVVT